jgi:hypothetical protein
MGGVKGRTKHPPLGAGKLKIHIPLRAGPTPSRSERAYTKTGCYASCVHPRACARTTACMQHPPPPLVHPTNRLFVQDPSIPHQQHTLHQLPPFFVHGHVHTALSKVNTRLFVHNTASRPLSTTATGCVGCAVTHQPTREHPPFFHPAPSGRKRFRRLMISKAVRTLTVPLPVRRQTLNVWR